MSRTIKDTPWRVMSEKALNDGFINNEMMILEARLSRMRRGLEHVRVFHAVVPTQDVFLIRDWQRWVESLGMVCTVKNGYHHGDIIVLCRGYWSVPGISELVHEQMIGDTVVSDPLSRMTLSGLSYEEHPGRFALDCGMSIRNDDELTLISGEDPINAPMVEHEPDPIEADVRAWMDWKARHDRRYAGLDVGYYPHRHARPPLISRNSVNMGLKRAVDASNSGIMDEGYDDPDVYHPKEFDDWWYY